MKRATILATTLILLSALPARALIGLSQDQNAKLMGEPGFTQSESFYDGEPDRIEVRQVEEGTLIIRYGEDDKEAEEFLAFKTPVPVEWAKDLAFSLYRKSLGSIGPLLSKKKLTYEDGSVWEYDTPKAYFAIFLHYQQPSKAVAILSIKKPFLNGNKEPLLNFYERCHNDFEER